MAPFTPRLPKGFKIPKGVSDASLAALPNIMDSSREEPANAHAKTASKDMKTSEISVPSGTDSGYVSAASTPDRGVSASPPTFTDSVVLPGRRLFTRKRTQLKPFEKEISESVQNRFSDLLELFDKPLYDHLAKSQNSFTAISIKLKVLGTSEATAKPWIVVQCQQSVSPKVKQFLDQHDIKSQYQPQNTEDPLPSFEIVVVNRPPRPMAASVFVNRFGGDQSYCCGALIKINHLAPTRFATLGGLISVTTTEGSRTIYGMTAGHVALQTSQSEDEIQNPMQADDEDDLSAGLYVEEEEFEIDEDYLLNDDFSEPLHQEEHETNKSWLEIGRVYANSYDYESRGNDLDWALLQVDDQALHLLQMDMLNRPLPLVEPSFTNGTALMTDVEVLAAGDRKSGRLSMASSFLRTGSARGFTKTYSLILSGDSRIRPGDCGSWVVNPHTGEVLGHVVAVDSFNEVYVVPLQETLRDMKERLGVASIALPTEEDLLDIVMDSDYAHIPKPHANEGQSGYDSGYATMQSSPAPSPPRGELFNANRDGTDQPSTFLGYSPPWTDTVIETIKQPLDHSLPAPSALPYEAITSLYRPPPPTPTAFNKDIQSPLDDSTHKPSTHIKRHFNDWIKRSLRIGQPKSSTANDDIRKDPRGLSSNHPDFRSCP